MDYAALRALIETHPTHAATSDADMVTWLEDDTAVSRDRTHIPSVEIQNICLSDNVEWLALTDAGRETVGQILIIQDPVPVTTGTPTRDTLQAILGTNTKAALGAALPETVSRLDNAGITETISADHIAHARTF